MGVLSKTDRLIITQGENKQKLTRKVDTYEYESLAKDILDDKVSYNSMIEIFNDKIYWQWFYKHHIESKENSQVNILQIKN